MSQVAKYNKPHDDYWESQLHMVMYKQMENKFDI